MTFDDILKEIGQFGSYQKRIYALLCVPALCLSALMVVNVFLLGIPEHRYAFLKSLSCAIGNLCYLFCNTLFAKRDKVCYAAGVRMSIRRI